MWPNNAWYVAAFSKEVGQGILARTLLGFKVALFRLSDGSIAALEDSCPHRRLPLSFGRAAGDRLVCGYHGMAFGADGKCLDIPGQDRIPAAASVRAFPIMEKDGLVWFWPGDPELAAQTATPDVSRMGKPGWVPAEGYCHLHADYRLLNDNLLDLSHVTFVHGATIGNSAVVQSPVKVTHDSEHVSVHRDVVGALAPPFYAYVGRFTQPIHRWHTVNYYPPSTCLIEVGCQALEEGDGLGRIEGVVMHLVTPETETTTHYFWAMVRNFRQDEAELTSYIRNAVDKTHNEDVVVLNLLQTALTPEQFEDPVKVALAVDSGPIHGRRLLEQMMQKEQAAHA
jgi:vanillate O-demethylase monooxygenase subunit